MTKKEVKCKISHTRVNYSLLAYPTTCAENKEEEEEVNEDLTSPPKAFQVIIREGGRKTESCQSTEDLAFRAVQNSTIPSTQLSRFGILFVKRSEGGRQRGAQKKEKRLVIEIYLLTVLDTAYY